MKLEIGEFLKQAKSNPTLDVRTPAEYEYGHIPGAINFPLFNNDERKTIGTIYKKQGHFNAILVGLDLVKDRMANMVKDAVQYSSGDSILIHCWRGGLRSESVAWLLQTARMKVHTLEGGYKSFRNHALDFFNEPIKLGIISGATGSGKTEILKSLSKHGEQVIDLEKLANHKGSVFGGLGKGTQPSTEHFQNLLFSKFSKYDLDKLIWVEDENPVIGKVAIPDGLWKKMVSAPRVRLMISKKERIKRISQEYGSLEFDKLCEGIRMLEKRLGNKAMNEAIQLLEKGETEATVEILLGYYDKAYNNSFDKKKSTEWARIERKYLDIDDITSDILELSRQKKLVLND